MPLFMRGNELEPLIRVQASQKWMRHPVFNEFAAPSHFDERQRPSPHSPQFCQHLLLFADHLGFGRNRRFAPPPFGWLRFPLVRRDGICGAQKFALCASKVFDDGCK